MATVDPDRREMLKRFAKWVPCQCDCGRDWNFVNEVGLSRGGDNRRDCDMIKLFETGSWMMVFKTSKVRKLQAMRDLWDDAV